MSQLRLDDLFIELLWQQWLLQIQRVIQCGMDGDGPAAGKTSPERRAASRAAWAVLDSLERVIAATSANDAYGIGMKLAIWRHWRDPGESCEGSDPSLALIRSAYHTAVGLSGVDFAAMIRMAETEAVEQAAGGANGMDVERERPSTHRRGDFRIVRVF